MAFENLEEVLQRMNNPLIKSKDVKYTQKDLQRTPCMLLTHESSVTKGPAKSWWTDYKISSLDLTRCALGCERADKGKELHFPTDGEVEQTVFSFFKDNKVVQDYIVAQANQHNFLSACRTEIMTRLVLSQLLGESNHSSQTVEFRKNIDGSYTVFEKFMIPDSLLDVVSNKLIKAAKAPAAIVTLETTIAVVDGEIAHTIQSFEFLPNDIEFCKMLFAREQFISLLEYVPHEFKECLTDISYGWEEVGAAPLGIKLMRDRHDALHEAVGISADPEDGAAPPAMKMAPAN